MKFYQRLAFFLFGLLLGVIFLVYFLGAKAESRGVTFCYLPNCRVLKDLRSKPFYYSEKASEILAEKWIDSVDVKNTLLHGDVVFSESNIKIGSGKKYVVKGQTSTKVPIQLELINYESKVELITIKK
ncbi:DUF4258 domain-containing protein [Flavobacterium orientale]|uniref:DUF4258 domain-containing protein n=1 Tax=Flavobacterium orientale TaxID=1756020 RepID=A0A916Y282_9FLAO|nr:DUF4258 domain-containing protein [Flavobacterium orientale]GGD27900.1 hypothetical protein GCM10011343_17630 [Flavobacterium orientale]